MAHARYGVFAMAPIAVPRELFGCTLRMLGRNRRLPVPVTPGSRCIPPRNTFRRISYGKCWFGQSCWARPTHTHFVILAQAILFRGAGLDVVWPQLPALLSSDPRCLHLCCGASARLSDDHSPAQ